MPPLLIIGGVTIDRLHFSGRTAEVPGGAGLYTALAAAQLGADVILFAQRPDPLPALLQPVDQFVRWWGPAIPLEDLPRLEIVHYGGGRAQLKRADWGAQLDLSPDALPKDLSGYQIVHIAALGPTARQLDFYKAVRGKTDAKISVGTYGLAAHRETNQVRDLAGKADLFFMNENECRALFGRPADIPVAHSQTFFVTQGERGAWALSEHSCFHQEAAAAEELDPTGAGDSFCGAVLASLSGGASLLDAVHLGVRLAAKVVQGVGPENLLAAQE